jgi:hypothetical protein
MVLADLWQVLQSNLFPLTGRNTGEVPHFNPYHDSDPQLDLPNAVHIRRQNLFLYLNSLTERPNILFIGEAPGWRGCRFSGIPFVCEQQVCSGFLGFVGRQSSMGGPPRRETTAYRFWQAILPHKARVLAWNCIPVHPHNAGNPLSNRTPTSTEIRAFGTLLQKVINSTGGIRIIAVGKKAAGALDMIGSRYCLVRHPSHGGANLFQDQVGRILG